MSSVRRFLLALSVLTLIFAIGCDPFTDHFIEYREATTAEERDEALGLMIDSAKSLDNVSLAFGLTENYSKLEDRAAARFEDFNDQFADFETKIDLADPKRHLWFAPPSDERNQKVYEYFCMAAADDAGSFEQWLRVYKCAPIGSQLACWSLTNAQVWAGTTDQQIELYLTTDERTESVARADLFLQISRSRMSTAEWFALGERHELDDKLRDLVFKKAIQNAWTTTEWLMVFDHLAPEDERRPAALQSAVEVAETAEDWSGIFTRSEHGSELEARALAKFAELKQDN